MDFQLDGDQSALKGLAARILGEQTTLDRLKAVEDEAAAGGDGVDRRLWASLAGAGLLAAPLAEENGGSGMGLAGAAVVMEEVGRRVAPVPYAETVLSGLAIEAFGSPSLRERVPEIASGSLVVTPALTEPQASPRVPRTEAASSTGGYRLDGEKLCVPAGMAAGAFLVPATLEDGSPAVFFVEADAPRLTRQSQMTTAGRPEALVRLAATEVGAEAMLGGPDALDWLVDRATAALCVTAAGCLDEALKITATYLNERKQFGRVIGSFQAAGQRAADAYIDALGVRLTAWQAVWRLSVGLPATDEVTIAKYWAAEAGQRVVHACQHLHGGIGMDRDYPIHRYFLMAKLLDLALGGAAPNLAELGRRIAASV